MNKDQILHSESWWRDWTGEQWNRLQDEIDHPHPVALSTAQAIRRTHREVWRKIGNSVQNSLRQPKS